MKLTLNRKKIDIALANKSMTMSQLANSYGCSRQRMWIILNTRTVTPITAGKIAKALEMPVEQLLED